MLYRGKAISFGTVFLQLSKLQNLFIPCSWGLFGGKVAQSDVVTDLVAHRHGVSLEIWWLTDMVSPWRSGGSQRCSLIGDLMAHRDGVPKKI